MKRIIVLISMLCTIAFAPLSVQAAEAEIINSLASFTASVSTNAINDSNRNTKLAMSEAGKIIIESPDPIHGIYLIWDKAPDKWELGLDGKILMQSADTKFLHEYVPIQDNGSPVSLKSLIFKADNGVLCDIYLLGEGESPEFVQKWQPPYEDADMLLLPTHADDEHLYFGGTMPYYSQDKKVQVAYFTVHSGEIYRQHELLDGLYTVGIRAYPVFSQFNDYYAESIEQAKGLYDENEAIEYMAGLIRRFKPEVIVGHDVNGEYGHGVHKYNTACLQQALPIAADTHQVLKTYLHLYAERPIVMDWSAPLEQFNGKTALAMAVEGFAAHVSQQKYFTVEASGPYDCRKFGLYSTNVGDDINKNDFFENIDDTMYSDYVAPLPPPVESELTVAPPQSASQPTVEEPTDINYLPLILAFLALASAFIVLKAKKKK